jgi:hypothetical protein
MKLPDWFSKKKDETTAPDPDAELDAAQRAHSEAVRARGDAEARVETVRDRLAKRDTEAPQALIEAKKELELAAELEHIAKRELDAVEAARKAALHAARVARRDELTAALTREAVENGSQELVDREARLCLQLIEIRAARGALAAEYSAKHHELLTILRKLGEFHEPGASRPTPDGRGVQILSNPADTSGVVVEAARVARALERLTGFPKEDPRAGLVRSLVRQLEVSP